MTRPDGPGLDESWHLIAPHDPHAGPYSIAKSATFYRLALNAPAGGAIVELGTSRGFGTVALAYGARDGGGQTLYTVDSYRPHYNWIGGYEPPEHSETFRALCAEAGIAPVVIAADVTQAGLTWRFGRIALLVWDLGVTGRMRSDFLSWKHFVLPGGRCAFRDVDNGCLGYRETLDTALARGWTNPQEWPHFIWSVDRPE